MEQWLGLFEKPGHKRSFFAKRWSTLCCGSTDDRMQVHTVKLCFWHATWLCQDPEQLHLKVISEFAGLNCPKIKQIFQNGLDDYEVLGAKRGRNMKVRRTTDENLLKIYANQHRFS